MAGSAADKPPEKDTGLDPKEAIRLLLSQRGMLSGYIASITGDPVIAEDVFQELSMLVLEKHAQIHGPRAFPAWARTAARHLAMRHLRKRGREPMALSSEVIEVLEEEWDRHDDAGGESDRLQALRTCMEHLTPRSRKLVKMRYELNHDGRQIAESFQRPINTIYVAMSRIHSTLADCVRRSLGLRRASG